MVRGLRGALVEAFSDEPLGGNGAAVVLLEQAASAQWMQRLAGRLQQSETAFLLPLEGESWGLRWFTPTQEVKLCGHATLAAVLALGSWGAISPGETMTFATRSGPLRVSLLTIPGASPDNPAPMAWIELPKLPLTPVQVAPELMGLLTERLNHPPLRGWTSTLGYEVALLQPTAPLAQLEGLETAISGPARQGLVLMQALGPDSARKVAGEKADYQLRFFAPGLGIAEDSVTGSAHALVAPFWMENLHRSRVVGWQCSDRPGGMVCEASSSAMIRLTGAGHLLWEGTLWAEPGQWSEQSQALDEWQRACAA
ncbi:MAG: PhzF family phenazine biosynthesis protein [Cyanobium sp.]